MTTTIFGDNRLTYKIKDECIYIDTDGGVIYRDTNPFPEDKIANEMIIIDFYFDISISLSVGSYGASIYDLKIYLKNMIEKHLDLKVEII